MNRCFRALVALSAACFLLALAEGVPAQCEQDKLTAPSPDDNDLFGISVDIQGDRAVVGAQWDDDAGGNAGAAYVYIRRGTSFELEQKLVASDGVSQDHFGTSVAIDGDLIAVGANLNDTKANNTGSVYMFRFDGSVWNEEAMLVPKDIRGADQFGFEVAISGATVVGGAAMSDVNGTNSGAAYVFRHDGAQWVEDAKLVPSDGAARDEFGTVVSISGDVIAAAAELDDDMGSGSGSVYVYRRDSSGWVFEQKIVPADGQLGDGFGGFVAVDGDALLAGAWLDDDVATDAGSAYVYRFDGAAWNLEQKITDPTGLQADQLGGYVALTGDIAVLGIAGRDLGGFNRGQALVLQREGGVWNELTRLQASDGADGDAFAFSVAVAGSSVLAGAFHDNLSGADEGSAYVFIFGDVDAAWSNYGSGWAGTLGVPALTASAPPVLGGALDLRLGNSSGQSATALLFLGWQASAVNTGLGGTLLVIPQLVLPLTLPGAGLDLPASVPCDGNLLGLHIYGQTLQFDAGASHGVSFSPGIDLLPGF